MDDNENEIKEEHMSEEEEDADLILARALQAEENALAGILSEESEDDDDFSHAKKRKIMKKKVTRK